MAKLKIIDKKLDEIREYENNPRRNDKAVKAARKSIEKFGFRNPILLNRDGIIISGHTRIKAAKEAGEETVPCIVLDHLTEEEERAFRLVDNRVGEFAEWDEDALLEEMKEIGVDDWKDFGFNEKDMKGLQAPDECTCPKCGKVFIDT